MAPLGTEHHEVQRAQGLDLEPACAAGPGLVRSGEALGHDPLVAAAKGVGEKCLRLGAVGGDDRRHAPGVGHETPEELVPLVGGGVDERHPVGVQAVEEERGERKPPAHRVDVQPASEAPHRDLEGLRPPVLAQGEHLAVKDDLARGHHADRLDDLGNGVRDLLEAAREDPHVAARLVDLHARAVELELEGGPVETGQGGADVVGRLGEHGLERLEDLEGEGGQRRLAVAQHGAGDLLQVAGEHERPPHAVPLDAGGAAHRLDHDAVQRALAQLAEDQAHQEALLEIGRGRKEPCQPLGARSRRPRPRDRGQRAERPVDVPDRQRRLRGGRGGPGVAKGGGPDPDAALRQPSAEVRHRQRRLGGLQASQQRDQTLDLLPATARGGHRPRGLDEFVEEHRGRIEGLSAVSYQLSARSRSATIPSG